jgi:hypothetical protein
VNYQGYSANLQRICCNPLTSIALFCRAAYNEGESLFSKEHQFMKETILPIVLLTPEAKEAMEAEAERAGVGGDVVGGLLFGYPLDERRRLVVGSVNRAHRNSFRQHGNRALSRSAIAAFGTSIARLRAS